MNCLVLSAVLAIPLGVLPEPGRPRAPMLPTSPAPEAAVEFPHAMHFETIECTAATSPQRAKA